MLFKPHKNLIYQLVIIICFSILMTGCKDSSPSLNNYSYSEELDHEKVVFDIQIIDSLPVVGSYISAGNLKLTLYKNDEVGEYNVDEIVLETTDPNIARFNSDGDIEIISEGTTGITVSYGSADYGKQYELTTYDAKFSIESSYRVNEIFQPTVYISTNDGVRNISDEIVWKPLNRSIVEIEDERLRGVSEGKTHVIGSFGGGDVVNIPLQIYDLPTFAGTLVSAAAILPDDSVAVWGPVPIAILGMVLPVPNPTDITQIVEAADRARSAAYSALSSTGTVSSWGDPALGGDQQIWDGTSFTDVRSQLSGVSVSKLFSNEKAFAALTTSGGVITWGNSAYGGDSSSVQAQLTDVETIYATKGAFAALKTNGELVVWGNPRYGGDPSFQPRGENIPLENIVRVFNGGEIFLVINNNGEVASWGGTSDFNNFPNQLNKAGDEIITFVPSYRAGVGKEVFSALLKDGSVVSWGSQLPPAYLSASLSNNIVKVVGTDKTFAALDDNGILTLWGDTDSNAYNSNMDQYSGVVDISSSQKGGSEYLITLESGEIIIWGLGPNIQTHPNDYAKIDMLIGGTLATKPNGKVSTLGGGTVYKNPPF
ncbi:hypothetical protein [Vibrio sp. TBV020]|uniref:hypothetical protein n=1 Tax=Vibrio sp. TBV020 TaxID=3137398 RepID=UPI0038CD7ACD